MQSAFRGPLQAAEFPHTCHQCISPFDVLENTQNFSSTCVGLLGEEDGIGKEKTGLCRKNILVFGANLDVRIFASCFSAGNV